MDSKNDYQVHLQCNVLKLKKKTTHNKKSQGAKAPILLNCPAFPI